MRLSDPLEKAVITAKENARRRGLRFLHPQYLIEAILQIGSMNNKLKHIDISPENLLAQLQAEIGPNTEPWSDPIDEGREYTAFMLTAEEKSEENGYTHVTISCAFAATAQLQTGSAPRRVFERFGLTEKILDAMITPATEHQQKLQLAAV